jgi:hypothetical protein
LLLVPKVSHGGRPEIEAPARRTVFGHYDAPECPIRNATALKLPFSRLRNGLMV